MKKTIYIYAICFFINMSLYGQSSIILKTPLDKGGILIACNSITLDSVFSYSAAKTGEALNLKVNPTICDPFAGNIPSLNKDIFYMRTKTFTTEDSTRYVDLIQYYDNFGYPIQSVQRGFSPAGADLIALQEYDLLGRDSKKWLPAVAEGNNGAYHNQVNLINKVVNTYNDQKPYSLTVYENSSLNRVLTLYNPGQDWHKAYGSDSKAIKAEYMTNTASGVLSCAQYSCGTGTNLIVTKKGIYGANELYVTKETDEDNNISYEFKDKQGQTILTRQMNGTTQYDTYYIYDNFGMLKAVLPPLASDALTATNTTWGESIASIKDYSYIYKYDAYNRCIYKKLPGCEPVYFVYDKADRIIFTQDGEQRNGKNEWTFNKYDDFGRVIISGILPINATHQDLINACKNIVVKEKYEKTSSWGYTWSVLTNYIPIDKGVLVANYYDNYDRMLSRHTPEVQNKLKYTPMNGYGIQYIHSDLRMDTPKGLLIGTRTRYFNSTEVVYQELITSMYYDNRARLIQTKSTNHLDGVDEEYIAYNFTGQATQRKHIHSATGKNTQTEVYAYVYDHAGRLLKTTHQLTDGTIVKPQVTLAENTYDELGRLKTNKKNNQANLTTTYAYNVRSWTKKIESPLFKQELFYNESYGGSPKLYNGNISAMSWKHSDETAIRGYAFAYDNLSRLTTATYLQNATANNNYKSSYTYDKHGNMKTLQRYGLTAASTYGIIDNLTMTYAGNQLTKAEDAVATISLAESADFKNYSNVATEYTYNKNGALSKDLNKGVSAIEYNSLNLPRQMDIKSPVGEGRNKYTYSAGGEKLRVEQKWNPNYSTTPVIGSGITESALTKTETTDYVGNIIYESHSDGTSKIRILVDGGYIENNVYYFYQNDHLGNNRVVANASGVVTQKTHYYPFGTAFAESTNSDNQPYKYNGKELDKMHGLNLYDYSARYYESAIGRFTTIDPKAESYPWNSPYMYAGNNSILNFDPDGEDYWSTNDPKLIKQFMNSVGRGAKYYDFTGWDHATDAVFTSNLAYNDATGKYYTSYGTIENGIATVVGKTFDANLKPVSLTGQGYSGAFVYEYGSRGGVLYQASYNAAQLGELSAFAAEFMSPFDPNSYFDGVNNWNVDASGRLTGVNNVQEAKKGGGGKALTKIFIKGFGMVNKETFHKVIKKSILSAAGKGSFSKVIGDNPDITIVNGKIVLQGTKPGFKGKTFNTELNANDFLK